VLIDCFCIVLSAFPGAFAKSTAWVFWTQNEQHTKLATSQNVRSAFFIRYCKKIRGLNRGFRKNKKCQNHITCY
jgi:hypothetical protein